MTSIGLLTILPNSLISGPAEIKSIKLVNNTSTTKNLEIYILTGDSDASTIQLVWPSMALLNGQTLVLDEPFTINEGMSVVATATADDEVSYIVTYEEVH